MRPMRSKRAVTRFERRGDADRASFLADGKVARTLGLFGGNQIGHLLFDTSDEQHPRELRAQTLTRCVTDDNGVVTHVWIGQRSESEGE